MSRESSSSDVTGFDAEFAMVGQVGGMLLDERIRSLGDDLQQGLHILDRFIGLTVARGLVMTADGAIVTPQDALTLFHDNFGTRHDPELQAVPGLQTVTDLLSDDRRMWHVHANTGDRLHIDTEDNEYYLATLAQVAGYLSFFQLPPNYRSRYPWRQVIIDDIGDMLTDEDYRMDPARTARLERAARLAGKAGVDFELLDRSAGFILDLDADGFDMDLTTQLVMAGQAPSRPRQPLY